MRQSKSWVLCGMRVQFLLHCCVKWFSGSQKGWLETMDTGFERQNVLPSDGDLAVGEVAVEEVCDAYVALGKMWRQLSEDAGSKAEVAEVGEGLHHYNHLGHLCGHSSRHLLRALRAVRASPSPDFTGEYAYPTGNCIKLRGFCGGYGLSTKLPACGGYGGWEGH